MNTEKYLIVYNKTSGDGGCKIKAERLARFLDNSTLSEVRDTNPQELLGDRINIIFGGDGTISTLTARIPPSGNKPKLVVAGGGSENHLYKLLKQRGAVVSPVDLKDQQLIDRRLHNHFHGEIDNSGLFLINLGLGTIDTAWAANLETLRARFPTFLSSYCAYLGALINLYPNNLTFRMVLTDNPIGPLKIPSVRQLSPQELMTIEIMGNANVKFVKAIMAACFWRFGLTMPKAMFKTEVADGISISSEKIGSQATFDGELMTVEGEINIRKSRSPLPVVALIS